MELTKTEKEILYLLTDEFLTQKKIAIRRKTSRQAVTKIVKSLKNKGFFSPEKKRLPEGGVTRQPFKYPPLPIRLHNQQISIKILSLDRRYKKYIENTNKIEVDGNTILLYKYNIQVYLNKSFYAHNVNVATQESMAYINKIINILENDLKIILTKHRSQNIKIVRQHYSEVNNELSRECERKGDKIRVHTTEDNKIWCEIDNSLNLREFETKHPKTSKEDMEECLRHFNDWRDNKPMTNTEITKVMGELIKQNLETASGLNAVVKILTANIPKEEKKDNNHNVFKEKPSYVG